MDIMIKLEKIRGYTRKIYENSSDVKVLQEELEDMLSAIDKNNIEYNKGKISKEVFEDNKKNFKNQSLVIIKKLNKTVDVSINCIKLIGNEVLLQKKEVDNGGNKRNKRK